MESQVKLETKQENEKEETQNRDKCDFVTTKNKRLKMHIIAKHLAKECILCDFKVVGHLNIKQHHANEHESIAEGESMNFCGQCSYKAKDALKESHRIKTQTGKTQLRSVRCVLFACPQLESSHC